MNKNAVTLIAILALTCVFAASCAPITAAQLPAANTLPAPTQLPATVVVPPTAEPRPASASQVSLTEQDAGKTTSLKVGDTLVISLAGNPTTGYTWEMTPTQGAILSQVGDAEYKPDSGALGASGLISLTFKANTAGHQSLALNYHRPWEKEVPAEKVVIFEVTVSGENGSTTVIPTSTPDLRPTPTTVVYPVDGMKGWQTYTNADYGFSLQYPPEWKLDQATGTMVGHGILLRTPSGTMRMAVSFKRTSEDAFIGRTGMAAGELVTRGNVMLAGAEVERNVLVFEGKDFTVRYICQGCMTRGELVFDISLDYLGSQIDAACLTPEVEGQADLVAASINLTK
jgi:inhibitor of cysteine peptidase